MFTKIEAILTDMSKQGIYDISDLTQVEIKILDRFIRRFNERWRKRYDGLMGREYCDYVLDLPNNEFRVIGKGLPSNIIDMMISHLYTMEDRVTFICHKAAASDTGESFNLQNYCSENSARVFVSRFNKTSDITLSIMSRGTGLYITKNTGKTVSRNYVDYLDLVKRIPVGGQVLCPEYISEATINRYNYDPEIRSLGVKLIKRQGTTYLERSDSMRLVVPAIFKLVSGQPVTEFDVRAAIAEFMQIRSRAGVPAVMGIEDPQDTELL